MKKNQSIIAKVVEEMGGKIEKIIPERGCFVININGEKIFVSRKFQISSDFLSGKVLTAYKDLTYVVLKENNIPTPNTISFYRKTFEEIKLEENLKHLSFPIVIKNAKGSNSKGVFTNIETLQEAKKTILREIKRFSCFIAQEMVFGKEYRVLMLEDKAIGVLEMISPRVFGDGKNTVKKLIKKRQDKTKDKTSFDKSLEKILREQGENLESVPQKGKEVFFKRNSCIAESGETKNVTVIINKEIESLCAKVAKIVDKRLVGLDVICEDIRKKPTEQNFNVIEANRRPDIYIHYNPTFGATQNVVKKIIDYILRLKTVSNLE